MAAKRAKFKVEEINEDGSEVAKESLETTTDLPTPETVKEDVLETVEDPKDLGANASESSPEEIKDWLKDVKPDVSKEVEKGSGLNFKLILFVMVLVLLIGAVVGGFFYYKKGVMPDASVDEEKATPVTKVPTSSEVSPTKTETDEKTANKDYKVQVLNGSGKVGEAGVFKTALTKLGFTSGNITTGNASTYDFKDTEVAFKEGVSGGLLDALKKELGDKYTVVKAKSGLEKDSKFDISITVGTSR